MASFSRLPRIAAIAGLAAWLTIIPSAEALLNIDGTRNQVFVFGSVTFGYNSNIFAESTGRGDSTVTAQVGAELKRRAGLIAVNSVAKIDFVRYSKYSGEDTINPNFSLELNKTEGRTTGAFTLQAYRETRSDSAVNLRTSSWNFPLGLSVKYPINDKFYVTSGTGYLRRTYSDDGTALVNYSDYSEAVDFYYTYTSKLDLLAGYRLRVSRTSAHGRATDHWFSVGATGGLFSKLSGTVRFGYQFRDVSGASQPSDRFDHFNASAAITWPFTRKLNLSFQLNRDFNTIATGASVDSTSLAARAQYAYSRKFEVNGGVAVGRNLFLGTAAGDRRDTFFSWDVGAIYRMNEHLQVAGTYTYFRNWSSLSFSDYDSQGFSIDISSRY
jgi:hypothetical protein